MAYIQEFGTDLTRGSAPSVTGGLYSGDIGGTMGDGFDVITRQEYIAWVQRSLNRIYGAGLVTDGRKTTFYRNLIRKFQRDRSLPEKGEVDSPTQDKIILANEANFKYMKWVQKALECDSVFADPPRSKPLSNGSYKSSGLKLGIKAFQGRKGLGKDGFVGAKTEVLLIKCCTCNPPGQQAKKKPEKPNIDYEAAVINQLKKAKDAIEGGDTLRGNPAILCVIRKLLYPSVNDRFVDAKRTNQYFRDSYKEHPDFDIYFFSAKKQLKTFLRIRWERGASVSVDSFITAVGDITRDMEGGMNVAYSRLTGQNIYETFRKRRIKDAYRQLVNNSRSLYSCKFAASHYKKSIDKL